MRDVLTKIVIGAAVGFLAVTALPGMAQKIQLNPIKPAVNQALTDEQQGILAVRSVKPAVVNLIGTPQGAPATFGGDSPQPDSQENGVEGTGFLIDSSGLVVTNNHVVQDDNLKYTVTFADGSQYEAKILGHDKYDDVALLKIDGRDFPAVKFGDSATLETGQTVFAIGNSLGQYQNSVTRGVVSGLGRTLDAVDQTSPLPRLQQLIQTDAAINPGNSGGPLIDLAGEVIGINTMIDMRGSGVGFAVPANVVKDVVSQIQMFGKVSHPYFGVGFVTASKDQMFGKPALSQGAYVEEVSPDSPAASAGLKVGDVIVAINHEVLTQVNELDTVIAKYRAGDQILVSFVRDGKNYDIPLILSEFK
ncbi:MAG: trypsin-like peptidase domain-containing protein [Patescibacteria group bacterium]|nr:trypsin-like peptidase domain-containing protein [Patescibacteria group bacterium]